MEEEFEDGVDMDELDGCDINFANFAVSDEEVDLLALFPSGEVDEEKAAEWKELFGG